jgi:hypothetical protein
MMVCSVTYEIKKDRLILEYEHQTPEKEAQLIAETIWLIIRPAILAAKEPGSVAPNAV